MASTLLVSWRKFSLSLMMPNTQTLNSGSLSMVDPSVSGINLQVGQFQITSTLTIIVGLSKCHDYMISTGYTIVLITSKTSLDASSNRCLKCQPQMSGLGIKIHHTPTIFTILMSISLC